MSLAELLGLTTRDPGECVVRIGGSEFSRFYANLQTTRITLGRRDSGEAELTFGMLREPDGQYAIAADERVRTWSQVEIRVVFGNREDPIFSGYIREIETTLPPTGAVATLTLKCQDIFAAMDRNCRRVTWEEGRQNLDIIADVIRPYGLRLKSNLVPGGIDRRHQNKTDYRFIRELAQEGNYEWFLRDEADGMRWLYFGTPNIDTLPSGPKIMVNAGRDTNCLSFDVNYDGYQPDRVRFNAAPLSGAEIEQASEAPKIQPFGPVGADSSDRGLEIFEWCLPPGDGNNAEAAASRAQGEAEARAFKLRAKGRLDGTAYGALLLPGTMVEVGGVGVNNGRWYVDKTVHTFGGSGYHVEFELIRNAAAGDESSSKHILAGVI